MFQTARQYSADEPDYGFSAVVLRYAIRTGFDWQLCIVKRGYLFNVQWMLKNVKSITGYRLAVNEAV